MKTKCPGMYCGRMPFGNDTFSDCGACERGWKRNFRGICEPCELKLSNSSMNYDLLFLAFSLIVPILIHSFLIDYTAHQRK